MTSLVANGLTSCKGGFGRACANWKLRKYEAEAADWSDGRVTFAPSASSAVSVVDELNLLLTSGRLNANASAVMLNAYEQEMASSADADEALQLVQHLFVAAPEFHMSNLHQIADAPRETKTQAVSDGTPAGFKAVIVMFLKGGADTFNLLVPHSNCASKDMYAEYETVRGDVALAKAELRPIAVPNGTQPCATFGLHPRLQYMQELYTVGDAAFVANIGSLIEPIDGVVS